MPTTMPTTLPLHTLTGFEHRFLDVDGVRLHAVDGGPADAGAIVLLAGFPQTWWAWRKVMPHLATDHRVIAVDLPGQGHSARPDDGYDTQTMARLVHGLVSALTPAPYWLAAHDVGAWVALPHALLHGEQLRGLALLDAGIPGLTMPEAVPLDPERAWKTMHFAFHLVPELPETLLSGREREYLTWFLRRKAARPDAFDDAEIAHYAHALAADGGLRAGLGYYRATARSAQQNRDLLRSHRLTMPVLGIASEFGSIPDMAAPLRPYADDVTGVRIPGAGHFIPEEAPTALTEALTRFTR